MMEYKMNPHVYLLVKIIKQSKEDFIRWCKFHANYGFAKIYVFDDGTTEWYKEAEAEIKELYSNFVFLNTTPRWNNRGEILGAFCKHCVNGDWGMILASNEYLWTKKWGKFDIRELVAFAMQKNHAHSISVFKEYLIKDDGYQFKSKDYASYIKGAKECPDSSVVLFSVRDKNICPLSNSVTPADKVNWFDTLWTPVTPERLMVKIPMFSEYPVRVFKLLTEGAVSDSELEKFNHHDNTLWPFYLNTFPEFEPKFKSADEQKKVIEESARAAAEEAKMVNKQNESLEYEIDGEVIGRVVSCIMRAMPYDEIVDDVKKTRLNVSDEDIKIIYDRECFNIIDGNKLFMKLIEMMSAGAKQNAMVRELHVSPKTLKKWKEMMLVIPAEIKAKFEKPIDNETELKEQPAEEAIPEDSEEVVDEVESTAE